jgi:Family of unknown function (DUF6527)
MKATSYRVLSVAGNYAEAANRVIDPGDCTVVDRGGVKRQLVLRCPDGCGEILSINLDGRSGPAWSLYQKRGTWSLFPSIDKPTGCKSHFILWRGRILWCDGSDEDDETPDANLISRIADIFSARASAHFSDLSKELDEIPWEVLAACRSLVRQGRLDEGENTKRGTFFATNS